MEATYKVQSGLGSGIFRIALILFRMPLILQLAICKRREHPKLKVIPTRRVMNTHEIPNKSQIYIQTANSYRAMHRSRHFQKP
jgi:hypothetical protein